MQYIQSPSGVSPPLDETGGDFPTFGGDHNAGGLANVSSNLGMFDDATPNNGAVLNTTASARRRTKRQKQFVPDVMRRDLYTSTAMVNTSLASSLRNNGDPHSGGGGLSPVISSQPGLSSSASGAYGATSGQQLLMQDRE